MAKNDDGGAAEVAAKLEEEQEAGARGVFTDPTPNHAYTVAGVTEGEPTPETDANLAREARERQRLGETKFEHGVSESSTETSTQKATKDSTSDGEARLTGEALEARVAELEIDASTGGSNADGSMSADEKRAAIAAKEAERGSGNGS